VGGAARVQGKARNTRDPSAQPSSGPGAPYKSKTKSAAAQRESEGIVVPQIVATKNAAGGKGPWGSQVVGTGKREVLRQARDPAAVLEDERDRVGLEETPLRADSAHPERRLHEGLGVLADTWRRDEQRS